MSNDILVKEGLSSVSESASYLGVSRSTVYMLMETGRLPYVKIGRSRRIPKQALIDFVKANLYQVGSGNLADVTLIKPKKLKNERG